MKQENIRNSFLSTSNCSVNNNSINNNYNNNYSEQRNHFLLNYNKFKQEISKANFDKIQLDEEEIQGLKLNFSNYQTA